MKINTSSEALALMGLTVKDFGVLLYYMGGGSGDIDPDSTEMLWGKNYLTKTLDGYEFNACARKKMEENFFQSNVSAAAQDRRFVALADKLRALYPQGQKDGKYSWRDNTMTIARKLKTLFDKPGCCNYSDEDIIDATRRYVDSFNGNYQYMQVLKYFILKRDINRQEETSKLLDFIQNKGYVEERQAAPYDNGEIV